MFTFFNDILFHWFINFIYLFLNNSLARIYNVNKNILSNSFSLNSQLTIKATSLIKDGYVVMLDAFILENTIRKIMIKNSKHSYILRNKSKFDKTYLNTICNVKDVDGVICN